MLLLMLSWASGPLWWLERFSSGLVARQQDSLVCLSIVCFVYAASLFVKAEGSRDSG